MRYKQYKNEKEFWDEKELFEELPFYNASVEKPYINVLIT